MYTIAKIKTIDMCIKIETKSEIKQQKKVY